VTYSRTTTHIGLDASFLAFLKKYSFVDFQQGGGIIQGLDGIKLRWRQNRLGVFCKARPAFNDTSEQFKILQPLSGILVGAVSRISRLTLLESWSSTQLRILPQVRRRGHDAISK